MSVKNRVSKAAERGVVSIIDAASLSQPNYEKFDLDMVKVEKTSEKTERSDINVLGKLLGGAGLAGAILGTAMELLPESVDGTANLVTSGSLGIAAVGAIVIAYDKLS